MSNQTTPIETVFEMQRTMIEQTEAMVRTAVETPKQVSETARLSGEPAREARTVALETSRRGMHQSLDAVESVAGDDEGVETLHEAIDDAFDVLDEQQSEACHGLDSEVDRYEAEVRDAVEAQVELALELNEAVETQVVEFATRLEDETSAVTGQGVETTEETVEVDISTTDETADDPEADGSIDGNAGEETGVTGATPTVPDDVPDDEVACRVCGETYGAITHAHLQTHDTTIAGYRETFGDDVPLRPDEN